MHVRLLILMISPGPQASLRYHLAGLDMWKHFSGLIVCSNVNYSEMDLVGWNREDLC